LAKIPRVLHEHINTAFPINVCLVATALPDGFAQVTPRGSTMVFDDEHLALWERGKGTTNQNLKDGTKVTVFFRKPQLREIGLLPKGGIARFYGSFTSRVRYMRRYGTALFSRRRSAIRRRGALVC